METLEKSYLEERQKIKILKQTEKEKIQAKMREIFYFEKPEEQEKNKKVVVGKDDIDPTTLTLNNNIVLREFDLKRELKQRKSYQVMGREEILLDRSSEKHFLDSGKSIVINPQLSQDKRVQENYAQMN